MGGADNEFDDKVDVTKTAIKGGDDGKKAESKKDEEHSKVEKAVFGRRRKEITQSHRRCPSTKWAQWSDKVFITLEKPGGRRYMSLELDPSGKFCFFDSEESHWLNFTLFDSIIVDYNKRFVERRDLTNKCLVLKKAKSNWWPRLLKEEGKPPSCLKVDWDKWVDEEDEEENIIFGDIDLSAVDPPL